MLLTTSRDQVGAERRAQPPRSSLLQTWQVLFVPETWRRMQAPHVRGSVPAAGPAAARNAPKGQQARGPRSGHQACGTTGTLPPRPIAEKARPRVGNTATVATVHAVHNDREMLLIDSALGKGYCRCRRRSFQESFSRHDAYNNKGSTPFAQDGKARVSTPGLLASPAQDDGGGMRGARCVKEADSVIAVLHHLLRARLPRALHGALLQRIAGPE